MDEQLAGVIVAPARDVDLARWADMRHALWPDASVEQHRAELQVVRTRQRRFAGFIALDAAADGHAVGFAECSLRSDYVNGCDTSPVAFLEGIWVHPSHRRRGVGQRLVDAVAEWAISAGCTEFAADALIDNATSHAFHRAVGFAETDRVVYFKRELK